MRQLQFLNLFIVFIVSSATIASAQNNTITLNSFTIKSDFFNNRKPCSRQGIKLTLDTMGEQLAISADSIEDMKELYCDGVEHSIVSKVKLRLGEEEYIIHGSRSEPIIFKVIKNKGYVYVSGNGSVRMPDGKIVKLHR